LLQASSKVAEKMRKVAQRLPISAEDAKEVANIFDKIRQKDTLV